MKEKELPFIESVIRHGSDSLILGAALASVTLLERGAFHTLGRATTATAFAAQFTRW